MRYRHKKDKDVIISQDEYDQLDPEDQNKYEPIEEDGAEPSAPSES